MTAGCAARAEPIRKSGITAWAVSPMNEPTNNKHTMNTELLFAGLDVHAKNITMGK